MRTYIFKSPILLVALLIGCITAKSYNDIDFDEFFFNDLDCVAKSGNPVLCEIFVEYIQEVFPKQLKKPFRDCVEKILPDGIGECTETEELYNSGDDRRKIMQCAVDNVEGEMDEEEVAKMTRVFSITGFLAFDTDCAAGLNGIL